MIRLLALFIPCVAWAQVTISLQPRSVAENEVMALRVEIDEPTRGAQLSWPSGIDTGPFELVQPQPSQGTQMTVVNGQVSHVQTLTYQLRPTKQGKLIFPAQEVEYDGKRFTSEPIDVEVGPPATRLNSSRSRTNPFQDPFDDVFGRRSQPRSSQPEMFFRSEVPKQTYYLGEGIRVLTKLYRRGVVNIANSSIDPPTYEDFWVEELDRNRVEPHVETVNGKQYEAIPVDLRILYPNKVGTLTIDPIGFDMNVSTGGFFARFQRVQRKTEPIQIQVKPLPPDPPEGFSGAVGNFRLDGELDQNLVKVGDSVSIRLTLSGRGRFSTITDLPIDGLDPALEFFAGGSAQVEQGSSGTISKTWNHAIVPKREGEFQIPAIRFSYFDPDRGVYQTLTEGPFNLSVKPGDGNNLLGGPVGQRSLTLNDDTIRFIKLDGGTDRSDDAAAIPPIRLLQLILGFVGLDIVILLTLAWRRFNATKRSHLRPKYAMKTFKRTLNRLSAQRDKLDAEAFFSRTSAAVMQYFGDKWDRPPNGISLELIRDRFNHLGVPDEVLEGVVELVEACDLARFTPASSSSRDEILERARNAVTAAEEVDL